MHLLALALILPILQANAQSEWVFDHIQEEAKGSQIFFKPPGSQVLSITLYEMAYQGSILAAEPAQLPTLVFTGRPCKDCLQDKAVYLLRPGQDVKPYHFVYPGQILDPKTHQLVLESRSFFGKCLPGYGPGYFVFQKERVDRRHGLQASVFVAEAGKTHLQEKLIERRLPRLQYALTQVKHKNCFEIEGRKRLMLSKPLDLTPRKGLNDDDKDDEDEPKENQTQEELPSQPAEGKEAAAAPGVSASPSPVPSPSPSR